MISITSTRGIPYSVEETMGALAQLVKEGKIRFIGLSEAAAPTCAAPRRCMHRGTADRILTLDSRPGKTKS